MIHLVVTDLDGTLLTPDHQLGTFSCSVLRQVAAAGIQVVIASGRSWRDVVHYRYQLDLPMMLITSNGARVHDQDGHLLYRHDLPAATVVQILALTPPPGLRLNIYVDDRWLVTEEFPEILRLHAASGFSYERLDHHQLPTNGVAKIFWVGQPQLLNQWQQQLTATFGNQITSAFSNSDCLEMMAAGVSKGEALQVVLASQGLNAEQVLAFGDGLNDLEMLKAAGHARLMANADPRLVAQLAGVERIGHCRDEAVGHYLASWLATGIGNQFIDGK